MKAKTVTINYCKKIIKGFSFRTNNSYINDQVYLDIEKCLKDAYISGHIPLLIKRDFCLSFNNELELADLRKTLLSLKSENHTCFSKITENKENILKIEESINIYKSQLFEPVYLNFSIGFINDIDFISINRSL